MFNCTSYNFGANYSQSFPCGYPAIAVACSRLSVVEEESEKRGRAKKKGGVGGGGKKALGFFFARTRFSPSPSYRESGTGYYC